MAQSFQQVVTFIHEMEKLKSVMRKIKPQGLDRYENSAEHSWQIALLGLSLAPEAPQPVDTLKVVSMLLLHDIVEIDTGDKFAYSDAHDDFDNELQAAKRLFALLPEDTADRFLSLWVEFESAETAEAKFAKAIDRMMPVLQNLNNGCQSWLEHGITISQVLKKNAVVSDVSQEWWDFLVEQVTAIGKKNGVPVE